MDLETYRTRFANQDEAAPGWDAIDNCLQQLYADQEPMHWGTAISHALGGPDPLDGISAYVCDAVPRAHLHFCSYGLSSLYYDEESVGAEFSRFGFELTFRLACELPPKEQPLWACNLLQNLARYVFDTEKWFEENDWIHANGPIRADYDTELVGLAFIKDARIAPQQTPHGRLEFIQIYGLTESELARLAAKDVTCAELVAQHRMDNPLLVTDLERRDS